MRELFALAIDRAVFTEVAQINQKVGRSPRTYCFSDTAYESLLHQYVELKLRLRAVRRWMCCYSDGDGADTRKWYITAVNRRDDLKQEIKAKRADAQFAAWGELDPTQK